MLVITYRQLNMPVHEGFVMRQSEIPSPKTAQAPQIIAAIYAIIGALWILFSDRILVEFVRDPEQIAILSTYKGWCYVLVTATLLYLMIRHYLIRQNVYADHLAREQQLIGITLETLPVGVLIVDANGTITRANKTFEEIWGGVRMQGKADYGEHKGWWSASGKPIEAHEWGVARALTRGESSRDEVIDIEAFNGQRKTILHSSVPLRDETGAIIGAIAVNQDITALKKAEAEIVTLNTALEQRVVERTTQLEMAIQELEAFSFSVSHDLQAPLHHIAGYSRALQEDYRGHLDDVGERYLIKISKATERMEQMIGALLSLSRLNQGNIQIQSVDLSDIAREICYELKGANPERPANISIQEGIVAKGEGRLLRTVMENLLENAWKYTGSKEEAVIEFGEMPVEGGRAFYVRDNGAGFSMEDADKLFTPFQRLHSDKEFPGIGIGLATVQRIIHRHGGRIWAESSPGNGAIFFFTLGTNQQAA